MELKAERANDGTAGGILDREKDCQKQQIREMSSTES